MLAATIGLRQESVGRIRMRLTEGLAGLVAEQLAPAASSPMPRRIPRFKYFPEAGEDPYRSFLGVPVIDRGLLQGVLVVQTTEPRVFSDDDVRMLQTAGAQLAPIVSEARTLGQFVAPGASAASALAQNLWWSWDADTTACSASSTRWLWREIGHNPVALLQQMPIDAARGARVAARPAQPHQLRLPADAGVPAARATPGAGGTPASSARGPSRTSPPNSACTSRCRSTRAASASWPAITSRAASDLGMPLVGIGLYYDQGYFRQRLDHDGWQHEDYLDRRAPRAADPAGGQSAAAPVTVSIETRTGAIVARVWTGGRRPQRAAPARLRTSKATGPRIAS